MIELLMAFFSGGESEDGSRLGLLQIAVGLLLVGVFVAAIVFA